MSPVTFQFSDGPSMYPTMASDMTLSIISRLHKYGRDLKVGDLIVAQSPLYLNHLVGKRVMGMPGDYVVHDPALSPTVGGAPMPGKDQDEEEREEPTMVQVPEGHVWVAGDNLSWSRDSRFYGPLPMALIRGKIIAHGEGRFYLDWRWFGDKNLLVTPRETEELAKIQQSRTAWTAEKGKDVPSRFYAQSRFWKRAREMLGFDR